MSLIVTLTNEGPTSELPVCFRCFNPTRYTHSNLQIPLCQVCAKTAVLPWDEPVQDKTDLTKPFMPDGVKLGTPLTSDLVLAIVDKTRQELLGTGIVQKLLDVHNAVQQLALSITKLHPVGVPVAEQRAQPKLKPVLLIVCENDVPVQPLRYLMKTTFKGKCKYYTNFASEAMRFSTEAEANVYAGQINKSAVSLSVYCEGDYVSPVAYVLIRDNTPSQEATKYLYSAETKIKWTPKLKTARKFPSEEAALTYVREKIIARRLGIYLRVMQVPD